MLQSNTADTNLNYEEALTRRENKSKFRIIIPEFCSYFIFYISFDCWHKYLVGEVENLS